LEARLTFTANQREWEGTEVVFEIAKRGQRTEVRFTHVGLVPAFECFDGCSSAWAFYVNESLKGLITGAGGSPIAPKLIADAAFGASASLRKQPRLPRERREPGVGG
jgi:hypothetical protein